MAHLYQRALPNLSRRSAIALERITTAQSEKRIILARRRRLSSPSLLDIRAFCNGRSRCLHTTSRRPFATNPNRDTHSGNVDAFEDGQGTEEAAFRQHSTHFSTGVNLSEHGSANSIGAKDDHPVGRFDWRMKATSRMTREERQKAREGMGKLMRKKAEPQEMDVNDPFYTAARVYEEKFDSLLDFEEAEDEAALRNRLSTWSVKRLEREGYCLTGVSAYWLSASRYGRPVASFTLGPGIFLPDNKLENGTQILVSRADPLVETPEKGSILSRTQTHFHVCFEHKFQLDGLWRLDLGRPNLMYDRMRTAVASFACDPEEIEAASDERVEYALQGTKLRDVLLTRWMPSSAEVDPPAETEGESQDAAGDMSEFSSTSSVNDGDQLAFEDMGAFQNDQRIVSWVKRYMRRDPIVLDSDPKLNLNESQRRAMASMIGRRISLIQGPPGTGKTKTIIETVKLLKAHFQVPHPILVCTYTNVAVDNLVEGLAHSGVKALRVGFNGNIRPSLLPHSLEHKRQEHPLYPELEKLVEDLETLSKDKTELAKAWGKLVGELKIKKVQKEITGAVEGAKKKRKNSKEVKAENMLKALDGMKARETGLERKSFAIQQQILRDVISDADVICTTCITAASAPLNVVDFPVVFLDEASMSTEPASLVPIMKGSQHLALIGDHKQLPPVIISQEARDGGLNVSLFERLTEEGHVHSAMLNTQYRMHPDISHFPALEFYDLALRDGTVDEVGNAIAGLEPPVSRHLTLTVRNKESRKSRPSVIFLDHGGNESMKGRSRVNVTEAHLVASVVEDLLLANPTLKGQDIGIIAPYAAQIQLLTRFLNHDPQYKARFESVLGSQRAMQLEFVEIKTVDGFEGREKEVIVFSTVRNNEEGHIGFLADKKRLNVGLTRAKRGLFVLGSVKTLKAGRPMGETSALYRDLAVVKEVVVEPVAENAKPLRKRKATKSPSTTPSESAANSTRGNESWKRYIQFMLDRNLVISLSGNQLDHALYGHVHALKNSPVQMTGQPGFGVKQTHTQEW